MRLVYPSEEMIFISFFFLSLQFYSTEKSFFIPLARRALLVNDETLFLLIIVGKCRRQRSRSRNEVYCDVHVHDCTYMRGIWLCRLMNGMCCV